MKINLENPHKPPVNVNSSKLARSLEGFGGSPASTNGLRNITPQIADRVYAAIQLDFARACRDVFYGMAIALAFAVLHPGGKSHAGPELEPADGKPPPA